MEAGALRRATNYLEALSRLPGGDNISRGPGIGEPVIRGLSNNQVLVLNNGVRNQNLDNHLLNWQNTLILKRLPDKSRPRLAKQPPPPAKPQNLAGTAQPGRTDQHADEHAHLQRQGRLSAK